MYEDAKPRTMWEVSDEDVWYLLRTLRGVQQKK